MTPIQEQLRAARTARELSQRALGERMGLPQGHISQIENGKVDPRLSSLREMARLLDYELILVPKPLLAAVHALVAGEKEERPLWQRDEPDEPKGEEE